MKPTLFAAVLMLANSAWANETMQPLFPSSSAHMVYPSVSGDYLVYTQRANHQYNIMRFNRTNFNIEAINITPVTDKDSIRGGIALNDGSVAYISNRLGYFTPWIFKEHGQTAFGTSTFNTILLPGHLTTNADAGHWVFDSTLETTRAPRITNQLEDLYLHNQLLGQSWRIYHEKFWAVKSDYPAATQGTQNKFMPPHIYTLDRSNNEIQMLGDGFDATISPDGKRMVYVRETDGNFDLWMQEMDGSNVTRLTKNSFADLEPSFSADGKRIVFVSNRDAAGDILQTSIYTLEIASGKIARITTGSNVTDGGPAWLDDQTIIFHSNRDPQSPQSETVDNWRLWTVNIAK